MTGDSHLELFFKRVCQCSGHTARAARPPAMILHLCVCDPSCAASATREKPSHAQLRYVPEACQSPASPPSVSASPLRDGGTQRSSIIFGVLRVGIDRVRRDCRSPPQRPMASQCAAVTAASDQSRPSCFRLARPSHANRPLKDATTRGRRTSPGYDNRLPCCTPSAPHSRGLSNGQSNHDAPHGNGAADDACGRCLETLFDEFQAPPQDSKLGRACCI